MTGASLRASMPALFERVDQRIAEREARATDNLVFDGSIDGVLVYESDGKPYESLCCRAPVELHWNYQRLLRERSDVEIVRGCFVCSKCDRALGEGA